MKTATKEAKDIDLGIKYRAEFLDFARDNDVEVATSTFMDWDAEHNDSRTAKFLEQKYGQEAIYAAGLQEMFRRLMYNPGIFKIKASEDNPVGLEKGVPFTSSIKGGINLPDATQPQLDYLLASEKIKFRNVARRLVLYKMSPKAIHSLLDEVLSD